MAPLVVRCPKTFQPIIAPVDTTFPGLAQAWTKTLTVPCPHCGAEHQIKVREAFVQSEIWGMAPRDLPTPRGGNISKGGR